MNFKILCGWMLTTVKTNPERVWDASKNAYDLPKLREALPSYHASDVYLAAYVTQADAQNIREAKTRADSVN